VKGKTRRLQQRAQCGVSAQPRRKISNQGIRIAASMPMSAGAQHKAKNHKVLRASNGRRRRCGMVRP